MAAQEKQIKAWFIQQTDMRGKFRGWTARLGDIESNVEKTPQAAFDALMELARPSCAVAYTTPLTAQYGPYTIVVWRDLYGFSSKIIPGGCITSDTGNQTGCMNHARDHVAQLLMNDGVMPRDAVREIAADKSLFDTLYPEAA